jgi:transposase
MKAVAIGVDIGKSSFHIHGVDDNGKTVVSKSLKRAQVKPFFSRQTSSIVGMESCSTSNYWAREITALGHDVKLIPAACQSALNRDPVSAPKGDPSDSGLFG